jgi:hypothetical protein
MTLKVLTTPSMLHFTIFKSLKTRIKKAQKQIKHKVITFILLASVFLYLLSEFQHISTEYIPRCTMTVLAKVYIKCIMQGRNTNIQLREAEA